MIANRRRPETTSRNSASRLPARSVACIDRLVTLPPGRARLATRPLPTGSSTSAKTIGTTDDACFAATAAFPPVTITSTLSRTNSAAISAKRSVRPSAQRYWMATVRPSIQPSSCSRRTKAAVHGAQAEGAAVPRNPVVMRDCSLYGQASHFRLHDPPPAPSKHLTRCLWNRVQAI
jgi:hypothetical protein